MMPDDRRRLTRLLQMGMAAAAGFFLGDLVARMCADAVGSLTAGGGFMAGGAYEAPDAMAYLRHGLYLEPVPLLGGLLVAGIVAATVAPSAARSQSIEVRPEEQYGKARWATRREREPFAHGGESVRGHDGKRYDWPKPESCERLEDDNIIMTADTKVALSSHPDRYWRPANKHVFVVAGSGGGKTFNFITTNVLQLNASYVFTDPKGELFSRFGNLLRKHGYEVRVLVLNNDERAIRDSNNYDPFHYVNDMTALNGIIDTFIKNTSSPEASTAKNEDFFTNMERMVYSAIWGMQLFWFKKMGHVDDFSIPSALDYLALLKTDGNQAKSELDLIFFGTREKDDCYGYAEFVKQQHPECTDAQLRLLPEWEPITKYEGFKASAESPETFASVVSSCFNRLQPFANAAVRSLFRDDEMELDQLGQRKQAIFLCIADTGSPYTFIASMVVSQLFSVNVALADSQPGGHLKVPVICYLDELANIGQLPNLPELFATLRSRWINLVAITQYGDQLRTAYKENGARGIEANCSLFEYLGAADYKTCEELSKEIGKRTVRHVERSTTRSASGTSVNESVKYGERPLISADELYNVGMDPDECITHIRNQLWYRGKKPNPMDHPRWKELQEAGEADVHQWAEERRRLKEQAERRRRRAARRSGGYPQEGDEVLTIQV